MAVAFALMLCSCKENKEKTNAEAQLVDTAANTEDSLLVVDSIKNPVPPAADEIFSDFMYAFTSNKRYQLSRINFPLQRTYDGRKTSPLLRRNWRFTNLAYTGDYYTVLYSADGQESYEKSKKLQDVKVELINLQSERVQRYCFNRPNGRWHLYRLDNFKLTSHTIGSFLDFYRNFVADSLYQRGHVANPLDFVTYDEDNNYERIEGVVDVDQWFAFRPELPHGIITNIDYGQKLEGAKQIIIVMHGISNSFESTFTFHLDGDEWQLVSFEN